MVKLKSTYAAESYLMLFMHLMACLHDMPLICQLPHWHQKSFSLTTTTLVLFSSNTSYSYSPLNIILRFLDSLPSLSITAWTFGGTTSSHVSANFFHFCIFFMIFLLTHSSKVKIGSDLCLSIQLLNDSVILFVTWSTLAFISNLCLL